MTLERHAEMLYMYQYFNADIFCAADELVATVVLYKEATGTQRRITEG